GVRIDCQSEGVPSRVGTVSAKLRRETMDAMYDMKNMSKLKRCGELATAAWQGFLAFDKAAMADGAIPAKTKELIAIAVAVTTQGPYCIEIHTKRAKAAG